MSSTLLPVSQVVEVYAIGQRIRFNAPESSAITEQLKSMTFEVEITKQLAVGPDRCSQVLIVRMANVVNKTLDMPLVAKFYDPRFFRQVDSHEWPGGREQLYSAMKMKESKA